MYDALIFDIDGTLWNASKSTAKGWNNGLESLAIEERVTPKGIESVAGNPYEVCIEILLPGLSQKHPKLFKALSKYEQISVAKEGGVFYEKSLEGIRKLSKKYPIFILSNCQDWYLEIFLKPRLIFRFFSIYFIRNQYSYPHSIIQSFIHSLI